MDDDIVKISDYEETMIITITLALYLSLFLRTVYLIELS